MKGVVKLWKMSARAYVCLFLVSLLVVKCRTNVHLGYCSVQIPVMACVSYTDRTYPFPSREAPRGSRRPCNALALKFALMNLSIVVLEKKWH